MADESKTAAEKAPEVAPAAPTAPTDVAAAAAETEVPAEKSEAAAPETTAAAAASAPEEAAQAAPVEGQTSTDPAAAAAAATATTTTKEEAAQPSSSAAVEAGPATTTTTNDDDKAALDKETGAKTGGSNSSASSVVAAADKKDDDETPKDASPATAAATAAAAAAPAPAAAETAKETEPVKTEAPASQPKAKAKTPLEEFDAKLPEILKEIGHDEMWGVTLVAPSSSHVPTAIVLQKFLNANDGDLAKALDQFKGALKFRKDRKPLDLLTKTFSAHKFADLGAVTVYPVAAAAAASKEGGGGGAAAAAAAVPEVFTWNLYGNVKGKMDEVFVPLNEFMDYRIALQELGIQQLKLSSATEPITADKDPYKISQVHDYKSISFLRQNPNVKAASTEVIKQFALAYPELLKEKFFVNVPAIMGWMYAVIKVFIAEKTAKKFHPMANGANLAAEFRHASSALDAKLLPKEYGGEGGAGDGKMKDIPGLVNELKFE